LADCSFGDEAAGAAGDVLVQHLANYTAEHVNHVQSGVGRGLLYQATSACA
jgi:hypothetical protein